MLFIKTSIIQVFHRDTRNSPHFKLYGFSIIQSRKTTNDDKPSSSANKKYKNEINRNHNALNRPVNPEIISGQEN